MEVDPDLDPKRGLKWIRIRIRVTRNKTNFEGFFKSVFLSIDFGVHCNMSLCINRIDVIMNMDVKEFNFKFCFSLRSSLEGTHFDIYS